MRALVIIIVLALLGTAGYAFYLRQATAAREAELAQAQAEADRLAAESLASQADPLRGMTRDSRPEVRELSLDLLATLEPQAAAAEMARILSEEKEARVLAKALLIAGQKKLLSAVEPAIPHLKDADPSVRRNAAWALGELGATDTKAANAATGAVMEAYKAERKAWQEAKAKRPTIAPKRVGERPQPVGVAPAEFGAMGVYIDALGKLKAGAPDIFAEAIRSEEPAMRLTTAKALASVGTTQAGKELVQAWRRETDPIVKIEITKALEGGAFGDVMDPKTHTPRPDALKEKGERER